MKEENKIYKIALWGILASLCMILSFVESMIPMPWGIPGIKLGLANLCIVFSLYRLGPGGAFVINLVRILLSAVTFSGLSGLLYSIAGAVLSFGVMYLLHKDCHPRTTSIAGSVAHVAGQLITAGFIVGWGPIAYYAPPVLLSAFISGWIIGVISERCINLIKIRGL